MAIFSPAQIVGYVSFLLGVAAFLQKSDRRLKLLNSCQGVVYAAHFLLLGNVPAAASSGISGVRSFVAARHRAPWLAWLFVAINLTAGAMVVRNTAGWLPVVASCAATFAMFMMRGIPLRLVLLMCTFMWLTNNVLSGSIGGTMLESTIAVINTSTIVRLLRTQPRKPLAPPSGGVPAES